MAEFEAALSADPTITVNRNGLSFDMPVRADLTAEGCLPFLYFRAGASKGVDLGYVALPSSAMERFPVESSSKRSITPASSKTI